MTRLSHLAFAALGSAAVAAGAAQPSRTPPPRIQPPVAFAQAQPGIWEVTGWPGSRAPVRLCVGDVRVLGRFEHRGRRCRANVVRSGPSSATVDYRCGPADFGSSRVDVITPRSLRIQTQGISNGGPFNYLIQARRVGSCRQLPARH